MQIVIMTKGRVNNQITVKWLTEVSEYHDVMFCCAPGEDNELMSRYGHRAVPFEGSYSDKFQWLLEGHTEPENSRIAILDDDLTFSIRELATENKLATVKDNTERLVPLFNAWELHLGEVVQCGIHPRAMGHQAPLPYKEIGKVIVANGVNLSELRSLGFPHEWRVDQDPILADVRLNCEILSRGQPNRLITKYCVDWGPSQAAGGCDYRTAEMQELAMDRDWET